MALVVGTNIGFVESAPVADPDGGGGTRTLDNMARTLKVTTPAEEITITEIGWWCNEATQEANFEVGIHDHNIPANDPLDLVDVSRTNAKGTDAGWKVVTGLNIVLAASTVYWISVQVDDTATTTTTDVENLVDDRYLFLTASTLPDPWVGGTASANSLAFYALYGEAPPAGNAGIMTTNAGFWGPTF